MIKFGEKEIQAAVDRLYHNIRVHGLVFIYSTTNRKGEWADKARIEISGECKP